MENNIINQLVVSLRGIQKKLFRGKPIEIQPLAIALQLKSIIVIMITFSMLSCSSDDDGKTPTTKKLRLSKSVATITQEGESFSKTYQNTYTADNFIKSYQSVFRNDPDVTTITPVYNNDGKMISHKVVVYGFKGEVTYNYDNEGRLVKRISNNTFRNIKRETTFNYNADGSIKETKTKFFRNEVEITSQSFTTTFEYSGKNLSNALVKNDEASTYRKYSYQYDANGNIIQVTNSDSTDGINFILRYSIEYTYDDAVNPTYEIIKNSGLLNEQGWSPYLIISDSGMFEKTQYLWLGDNSDPLYFYSKNNIKTYKSSSTETLYEYTYNDNEYPIKLKYTLEGEGNYEYNFTYEEY